MLMSLQLIIKVIREPPLRFERLMRWHFKSHKDTFLALGELLSAFRAMKESDDWARSIPPKAAEIAAKFNIVLDPPPSSGFVAVLEQLVPKLRDILMSLE
jgi:hypothetical protein